MTDINIATLTGRLVRDPNLRNCNGGTLMGYFTLASNQRYKDKAGAVQEETAFLPCKAFGRWAEPLANHRKGEMAIVSGRLRTETWEKDGVQQSQLILVCDSLHFVSPAAKSSAPPAVPGMAPADNEMPAEVKKAIPF
jgi:single-strand DNA-binding protein